VEIYLPVRSGVGHSNCMMDANMMERVVFMATTVIGILALIQRAEEVKMTTGGWVFMIGAWTAIISLVIYCFSKVLRNRKK
jgi:hypothetical protein